MEYHLNFEALKRNLIDVTKEFLIKLGYTETAIGLYYPFDSLNRLLDAELSLGEMEQALQEFVDYAKEPLGQIVCSHDGTRFCFLIPAEGVSYVYHQTEDVCFLKDFIAQMHCLNGTLEELLHVFSQYSDKVRCEKIESDEFDYLIFFEDGIPDDFRYCIKFEYGHVNYHRFTPKDYDALQLKSDVI